MYWGQRSLEKEVFTPQGMLTNENWAEQMDRPEAQHDREVL